MIGPYAEPYPFAIQRPRIAGAVRIDLDDPVDPTPYWVISSRHPAELAAAIRHAKTSCRPEVSGRQDRA